jgi:hypothetical protein
MRTLLVTCTLLAPLAVAAAPVQAKAPGPGWEEANRKDDLVIFTKDNSSAGVREIRAISEFDAAPGTVFQVVGDFVNYAKFMPYVKESRITKVLGENELVTYQLLSPPLVSNRDYFIHVKKTPGNAENGQVFRSEWKAVPETEPDREGVVRVRINSGSWTLEPLDGGRRTRITYSLLTHPGGSIPSWVANASNTTAIPDLFAAIRKRAAAK